MSDVRQIARFQTTMTTASCNSRSVFVSVLMQELGCRWLWNLQASVPRAEVLLVVTHVDCVEEKELKRDQKMMQAEATKLIQV